MIRVGFTGMRSVRPISSVTSCMAAGAVAGGAEVCAALATSEVAAAPNTKSAALRTIRDTGANTISPDKFARRTQQKSPWREGRIRTVFSLAKHRRPQQLG